MLASFEMVRLILGDLADLPGGIEVNASRHRANSLRHGHRPTGRLAVHHQWGWDRAGRPGKRRPDQGTGHIGHLRANRQLALGGRGPAAPGPPTQRPARDASRSGRSARRMLVDLRRSKIRIHRGLTDTPMVNWCERDAHPQFADLWGSVIVSALGRPISILSTRHITSRRR
jgi:hypothetical protein